MRRVKDGTTTEMHTATRWVVYADVENNGTVHETGEYEDPVRAQTALESWEGRGRGMARREYKRVVTTETVTTTVHDVAAEADPWLAHDFVNGYEVSTIKPWQGRGEYETAVFAAPDGVRTSNDMLYECSWDRDEHTAREGHASIVRLITHGKAEQVFALTD